MLVIVSICYEIEQDDILFLSTLNAYWRMLGLAYISLKGHISVS